MGGDSHGDNYDVIVFWAMTPCNLLEIYRHSEDGRGLFFRKKTHTQRCSLVNSKL